MLLLSPKKLLKQSCSCRNVQYYIRHVLRMPHTTEFGRRTPARSVSFFSLQVTFLSTKIATGLLNSSSAESRIFSGRGFIMKHCDIRRLEPGRFPDFETRNAGAVPQILPISKLSATHRGADLSCATGLLVFCFFRSFLTGWKNSHDSHHVCQVIPRGGESAPSPPRPRLLFEVEKSDVEELVNECLKDPEINIGGIPDWIERQIYRVTIRLTLNALYRSLGGIHGKEILGYEFELSRLSRRKANLKADLNKLSKKTDAQEEILETVAKRLLQNKNINNSLIPDVVEQQLYTSCLKIVFRVLDLVADTFTICLCGHDLKLALEPSTTQDALEQSALKRSASKAISDIDVEYLTEVAREISMEADRGRWFWQRWLSPSDNKFIAQLHASIYCLVLGIIDDLLQNTEIHLLSDRIKFDLVESATSALEDPSNPKNPTEIPSGERTQKADKAIRKCRSGGFWTLVSGAALGYYFREWNDEYGDSVRLHMEELRASMEKRWMEKRWKK